MVKEVAPTVRPTRSFAIMPVDYTAYLLSSSPPGFEYSSFHSHFGNRVGFSSRTTTTATKPIILNCRSQSVQSWNVGFSVPKLFAPEETEKEDPCEQTSPEIEESGGESSEPTSPVTEPSRPRLPSISTKTGKPKKMVSFADHKGKALCEFRIMTEASDQPPRVRPELLASLTAGATAGVSETPPFELNFPQPASDYLPFREKLEKNLVSLENVILKDYNMMGTVKVKNIAFEKDVCLKITFDSWESTTVVPANYVANLASESGSRYDTFSFDVDIPTNTDISKKIQFCVCYSTNGEEFWDNNNGMNYEVISHDWKHRHALNSDTNGRINWTTFRSWQHMDKSIPYW